MKKIIWLFLIEARKELNEGYSTIKGFFRQYELTYFVADERDVIRLRTKLPFDQLQHRNDKRIFVIFVLFVDSVISR